MRCHSRLPAWLLASAFGGLLMGLPIPSATADQPPPPAPSDFWVPDRSSRALTEANGLLFLGGEFDRLGRRTGSGAAFDLSSGAALTGQPVIAGRLLAAVSDGAGGWYLGGEFTLGPGRNNLARLRGDFSEDARFQLNPEGAVRALALRWPNLFVAGSYTQIAGKPRRYLAALDATTGSLQSFDAQADGPVNELLATDNTLYVGGEFGQIGGQPRQGLAALDPGSGLATPWHPQIDGQATTLALRDDTLYLGGAFTAVGGRERTNLAAVTTLDGALLPWNPSPEGPVTALVATPDAVYVGGAFTRIAGQPRAFLAALNPSTGELLEWDAQLEAASNGPPVSALAFNEGALYVAGSFSRLGGEPRSHLGAVEAVTAQACPWDPRPDQPALGLATFRDAIYAWGAFRLVNLLPRARLAALSLETGALTSWQPPRFNRVEALPGDPATETIRALAVCGSNLWVGGRFTSVAELPHTNLVILDLATGQPRDVDVSVAPVLSVETLAVAGNTVYAGGTFSSLAGVVRSNLAALDGHSGQVRPWHPDPPSGGFLPTVRTLTVADETLYVGGAFAALAGRPRALIGAFDARTNALRNWAPDWRGDFVEGLAALGSRVYVAAQLTSPSRNLSAFDAQTGQTVAWSPTIGGGHEMRGQDRTVYCATEGNGLVALDAESGGLAWAYRVPRGVARDFLVRPPVIFAAGSFQTDASEDAFGLAVFPMVLHLSRPTNGTRWLAGTTNHLAAHIAAGGARVTQVDFYANDRWIGRRTAAPFEWSWVAMAGVDRLAARAVIDGRTNWSPAVSVRIEPPAEKVPPEVTLTAPREGEIVLLGQSRLLTATATDRDGKVIEVEFRDGDRLLGVGTNEPYRLGRVVLQPAGRHTLTARAMDNLGLVSTSAPVSVTVAVPPQVRIVQPLPGADLIAGQVVTLAASAHDPDGQIQQVIFSLDDVELGTASGCPYALMWTNLAPGTHILQATATDDLGLHASTTLAVRVASQEAPKYTALDRFWTVAGQVDAVVATNGGVYLGGIFDYVGPYVGGAIGLDPLEGRIDGTWPTVYGVVHAAAPDGAGGWYLGGTFHSVGGWACSNLVHLRRDRTVNPCWMPALNGAVTTVAVEGDAVYVAGTFSEVNGQTRPYVAALDRNGVLRPWVLDIRATEHPIEGPVMALAVTADRVYLGGTFTSVNGYPRNRLAAVDRISGAVLDWSPSASQAVRALAVDTTHVYFGGHFSFVEGEPRSWLAAVDAELGWLAAWDPGLDGQVNALALHAGRLFVAGAFTTAAGQPRQGLAAFDLPSGTLARWNPDPDWEGPWPSVDCLTVCRDTVYVGGSFDRVRGQPHRNLVAFDARAGALRDWGPSTGHAVSTLATDGASLLAGGRIACAGGEPRAGLAHLDVATGQLSAWDPAAARSDGHDPWISALALADGRLYVGGGFNRIGGAERPNLAALDLTTGQAADWQPQLVNDARRVVREIAIAPSRVYFAGEVYPEGGETSTILGAVDRLTGQDTGWQPPLANGRDYGWVSALQAAGDRIFVGGFFDRVAGAARTNLAALDPSSAVTLPWVADAGPWEVSSLALADDTLFVGGVFDHLAGVPRQSLGAVSARAGEVLSWQPQVPMVPGTVASALLLEPGLLHVGGYFGLGDRGIRAILLLDRGNGQLVASVAPPFELTYISALASDGENLYSGGFFAPVQSTSGIGFRAFRLPALPWRIEAATLRVLENGAVAFRVLGPPGTRIAVQGSPDLHRWDDLDVRPLTGASFEFVDPTGAGVRRRFYRLEGR